MMNIRPTHIAYRGATLTVALVVVEDAAAMLDATTSIYAEAKKISGPQDKSPGDDAVTSFILSATFTAATSDDYAYWLLEYPAASTEALSAGFYIVDARLTLDGGRIVYTSPITIDLRERVTEAQA